MPWSAADPPAGAPQRQRGLLSRRLAGALLLTILGIGHVLFGVTNFGFVERLPGDLATGSALCAPAKTVKEIGRYFWEE